MTAVFTRDGETLLAYEADSMYHLNEMFLFSPKVVTTCLMLLMLSVSNAGYYNVTYSGQGAAAASYNGATKVNSYTVLQSPDYQEYGAFLDLTTWMTYTPSSYISPTGSASGTITATFTWVPASSGDMPPSVISVRELSSASWYGLSGTADDGLGDQQQTNTHYEYPLNGLDVEYPVFSGWSHGTRDTLIQNPSTSFTTSCSPRLLSVVGWPPDYQIYNGGGGWVTYHAMVVQPSGALVPDGVINDSNEILIGQQLTTHVTGVFADASTFTYKWSVSNGAFPFSAYTVNHSGTEPTNSTVTTLEPGSSSSLSLYFQKPSTWTIACLCSPIGGDSVAPTLLTATGTSEAPDYSFEIYSQPNATIRDIGPSVALATPTGGPGIVFSGSVSTPSKYNISGSNPATKTGSGSWNLIQLFKPYLYVDSTQPYDPVYGMVNGTKGLDVAYPYNCNESTHFNDAGDYNTVANGTAINPGGVAHALGEADPVWEDSPAKVLPTDPSVSHYVEIYEQFWDYIMYYPPVSSGATKSQYVPLCTANWWWFVYLTCGAGSSGLSSDWSFSYNLVFSSLVHDSDRYPAFPIWDLTVNPAGWTYKQ